MKPAVLLVCDAYSQAYLTLRILRKTFSAYRFDAIPDDVETCYYVRLIATPDALTPLLSREVHSFAAGALAAIVEIQR
jgi:hypothetical protein